MIKTNNSYLIVVFIISLFLIIGCRPQEIAKSDAKDNSLQTVKDRGELLVGISIPYEPMEFIDENGDLAGIDVDVAKEIASELGVKIKFEIIPWDDLFEKATSNEADIIIGAISITHERSEKMLFSRPYFDAGQVMIIKKDNQEIKNFTDLIGKRIGVQKGTTGEAAISSYINSSNVTFYEEDTPNIGFATEGTKDLLKGNIDVMIIDYIAAIGILHSNPNLKIVDTRLTEEFYGIATNKANQALMLEINTILQELIQSKKINTLTEKWTN